MTGHGTEKDYKAGCHCEECKAGHADFTREWRWRNGETGAQGRADAARREAAARYAAEHPDEWAELVEYYSDPGRHRAATTPTPGGAR